ncbi:hypothetical protein P171DRAFT_518861 [Karstenula rhodostoma CBS 690.94]|uniref:Uncharacterized protein n=1 Tax=Karstenula rhodostoma CBS 690.94 TaxID=1392251 RepID=A0A9P4UG23_9PLEO|nr:hypothetical protein P171DRAFT_518861 [Karstenula rhodostoma CBS 690.94]
MADNIEVDFDTVTWAIRLGCIKELGHEAWGTMGRSTSKNGRITEPRIYIKAYDTDGMETFPASKDRNSSKKPRWHMDDIDPDTLPSTWIRPPYRIGNTPTWLYAARDAWKKVFTPYVKMATRDLVTFDDVQAWAKHDDDPVDSDGEVKDEQAMQSWLVTQGRGSEKLRRKARKNRRESTQANSSADGTPIERKEKRRRSLTDDSPAKKKRACVSPMDEKHGQQLLQEGKPRGERRGRVDSNPRSGELRG